MLQQHISVTKRMQTQKYNIVIGEQQGDHFSEEREGLKTYVFKKSTKHE